MRQLGANVWCGDKTLPLKKQRFKALETPVGIIEYTKAAAKERVAEEQKFWNAISSLSDL